VHPSAAIAANTVAANTALANALFMLSPGPEQFLTCRTALVNLILRQFRASILHVNFALSGEARVAGYAGPALTASDTQA
jgi:hypothetical protein